MFVKFSLKNAPIDYPQPPWFNSAPICISVSVIIILYAISGVYFPLLSNALDFFINPIMSGLDAVGVRVAPVITGPFQGVLYRNLSGISFVGALVYNLVSVLYMIKNKRAAGVGCVETHALLMKRKQLGATKAWLLLRFYVYVGVAFFIAFGSYGLLNGVYHWTVFEINDNVLGVCFVSLYFFFLGMTPAFFYAVYFKYIVFDVRCLIKKIQG
ncbi:hypothetical protein HX890_12575 [Pseudomonas gingeri]|uniref:hypothetical protein n=1 Tax=Pseudomonas gingeri TaxID=117681 RepID=UPI00159F83F2|nr:hypothetical protein [Pseudomonas gingeri]NWD74940.1 hypothetical protein [Pseudomonas gingeri]